EVRRPITAEGLRENWQRVASEAMAVSEQIAYRRVIDHAALAEMVTAIEFAPILPGGPLSTDAGAPAL
ncbi:MAG: hypothetical protein ACRC1H_19160, partial [Caldilineaceae bacterium]